MAKIKFRRDTAANWILANPILAQGEPGFEHDTGLLKIGDGETAWNSLGYSSGSAASLTDEGNVVVQAGSTAHWIATQRRENYDTQPRGLRYDSQGNLYALTASSEAQDPITVITKYTAAGAVAWQKTFTQVDPYSLAIDSTDRAYITVSDGDPEITVIKFSTTGDILWEKSYDVGALPTYSAFIEEKSATTLALVAQAANGGGPPQSVLVLEISSTDGSVLLKKTLALESLELTAVAGIDVDSDENVFVTGYYYDVEPNLYKMFIEKLDENLNRVWSKTLEAPDGYNMNGGDCASDAQGNIYAVGSYEVKTVNADDGTVTKSAAILTKLNSSGVVQWTRRVGPGPCGGFIVGLTATDVGDVYLSSTTYENKTDGFFEEAPEFIQEAFRTSKQIVARYNTQGAVIWQRYVDVVNLNEEPSDFNRGQAVAVFGNKFAVDGYGFSTNNAGGAESSETGDDERDYFVVQLPTDGTELTIGNLSFTESRIPGRFVTHEAVNSSLIVADYSETILAEDSEITADAEARIANNIIKSETYSYTFGADGTLTIPNDGDLRLTQTQVGYLMAVDVDANDDITGRATCVDSQGYLYFGGQDDDGTNEPFVMKIGPTGDRVWGVIISEDGGNSGRVNALSINPTTGNLMVLAEMTDEYDYSILVTMDQDTGRILSHQKFSDTGSDVNLVDIAWTSTGTYVLGGWKDGEFSAELPVVPQTGSTTGVIRVLRSALPAEPSTSWQIGGTDISPFENIAYVERYTGLTGTTRQGSGATFNVELSQPSTTELQVVDLSGAAVGGSGTLVGDTYTTTTGGDYITFSGNSALRDAVAAVTGGGNDTVQASWSTGSTSDSTWVYVQIVDATTFQFFTSNAASQAIAGSWIFPVTLTGNNGGAITSVTVNAGGTNYLPGHQITIPYTAVNGNDSNADIILTVTEASGGAIVSVASGYNGGGKGAGGTYTAVSGTNRNVGSGFTMTFEPARDSNNYSNYWSYQVTAGGSNYVENDIIVIPGTSLGGTSPANDLTVRVNVNNGAVQLAHEFTGTGQTTTWKLDTTAQVDFGGTGSWSLTYPNLQEGLLVTPTWQRTFNTSATVDDYIDAVAVDSNNNIIAVGKGRGELNTGNFRDLALVFQFNSSGALQWVRQLNETGDHCYGQSVITIGTDIYVTHDSNDDGDTVITKLDATGAVKWQRRTQGGDDSCIARTANGNLMVAVEEFNNALDEEAIKVFQLTASGETVYKRWLSAHTNDDTRLASARGLSVDNHSFYIGAYYDNNNSDDSGLAVRLPIDGSGTGNYGSFRYVDVNPETNNFSGNDLSNDNYSIVTINIEGENNYAGALAVAPTVSTGTAVTTGTGTFYVDSWYPDLVIEPVHDTDGGSIVFADGSTQSTSATDIPQRRYNGQRYTLGLKDRGHHILCDISDENIIIPYYSRVPFPVGSVITIVNASDSSIGINVEGQSTSVMLAGEGYYSFYLIQAYGVVTLLNIGPDRWVISGNVNPD